MTPKQFAALILRTRDIFNSHWDEGQQRHRIDMRGAAYLAVDEQDFPLLWADCIYWCYFSAHRELFEWAETVSELKDRGETHET